MSPDQSLFRNLCAAAGLTPRETDCLCLAAAGLTSTAIGQELGIGKFAVDNALRLARARKGAASTLELYALVRDPLDLAA